MPALPTTIERVDAEWLSQVLGAPVVAFEKRLLEGGVLSDAYRLDDIRYANGSARGPRSLIVKLPHREPDRRAMAIGNGAYRKELRFFRELAPQVPLRSPAVYAALCDGSPDVADFALVLEDLASHSRVFDQVEDRPDEACVRRIALEVAALHARFWDAPETRLPWVADDAQRYVFALDSACREAPDRLEELQESWRRTFGRELLEEGGCANSERLTRTLLGPANGRILDRIYDRFSRRPRTLLHGDLRADNIFRDEASRLTYIDWQLLGAGPPGPEFTQAWIHSLPPELRRKDRDFLRLYHDRLVSLNPAAASYSYDMLVEDYVLGICMWWAALVSVGANTAAGFGEPGSERMQRLWSQGIAWSLIALEDHGCMDVIEALAEEG